MEISDTPIYRLAERVYKGELPLTQALEEVASDSVLAQVDEAMIDQLDLLIRGLPEADLQRATIYATLNCKAARRKGDDFLRGVCSTTLGWHHKKQHRDQDALDCYQEALIVFRSMHDARQTIAQIQLEIGEIREHQNNQEAAQAEYQSVRELAEQLDDSKLMSRAHIGLGRVHLALEETDEALAAFQRALEISQQDNDQRGQETALGNLGLAHRFLGQLQEAAKHHQQALTLSQKIKHTAGTGRHLNNMGNILLDQGKFPEAEDCYTEALEIAHQTNDRLGEQQRLDNLGNLYHDWACQEKIPYQRNIRLAKAKEKHQAAITLARQRSDRPNLCNHLLNLGNVYFELKKLADAQQSYNEALALVKEQHVLDTEWRIHYAWGKLCDEQNQDRQARDHYQNAINIVEQQRKALRTESRTKFWQERSLLYKRMMLCCLRLNDLWAALEHTERAKARYLADLLSQHTPATENTQAMIRAVLQALPKHTAGVVFNVTEAGTVVFIVTGQPCVALKGSDDPGWQLSPDHHIRAKLIEEFDRDRLERLLVQRDESGQPRGGYLVEYYAHRNEIEKWKPTLKATSTTLAQSLLAPIHQQLKQLQIERLVLMPNLGLSVLPLHASNLADGDKPDYMLDHYEITYAPSFDVLRHCQNQAHGKAAQGASLLAIANPNPKQALPWAEFEVEQIAPWFQARILDSSSAAPATRETVLAQAPQAAVLHFACHGSFDLRDPLQSALMLRPPDVLTLAHILRDCRRLDARLVVMSACETGLVDPGDLADEYMGLPAGFLQAGAPTVVSSLWAVDDISTALLMIRFYQYYLIGAANKGLGPMRPGLALRKAQEWLRNELTLDQVTAYISRQEATSKAKHKNVFLGTLRKAKRELINDNRTHPFADPYYWAAFTVLGDV